MAIDLALYRRQVRVSQQPLVRLSAIDVSPDHPQRTIVFVHGFGGQASQWQYQLHQFSFSNRVVALDLRGHGLSDRPNQGYSMARIQEDLEIALAELAVEDGFVLVGHSFGGAITTEFATNHLEAIESLILVSTAGVFKLNLLYRLLLRLPQTVLRAAGPFTRDWLSAPPWVLQAWYHHNLARWNGWSLFRSLQVPTTVIRGHLDIVFERPLFEEVARAIPNADEIDVGASGHMVMLERREAVNRAIQRALQKTQKSWRDEEPDTAPTGRAELVRERTWLSHYDEGVPFTVAIPQVPLHYLLRSAVSRFPLHHAIIYEGNKLTYRRLGQEVNRFANALRSLGIDSGDRVMLLLPNLPQLVIAFFGTLEAGAVVVFSLPSDDPQTLVRQIRASQARVLVTLTQYDELVQQIRTDLATQEASSLEIIIFTHIADYLPALKRVGFIFSQEERKRHLFDIPLDASAHFFNQMLYTHSSHSPDVPVQEEELAVIHYTGGITAEPKGVMLSHRNLLANTIQTRHWMPNAREGQERFLCVLPFAHSYGLTAALNVPVALGATLIIKPVFDASEILKSIRRYRPTIFPGVPSMYMAIKDYPGVRKFGIHSIKACISGSAPLPVEVQESFEKLTRGRLVEGYGLTEAGPVTHANPLEGKRKVGSIGVPLPSTEACVVDLIRGNQEVEQGHIGELAVRGPQVMLGYWDNPKATRKAFNRDGWLLTGDVAQVDPEGYFRIIARKVDLWYPEKPGNPAFPRDVEEVLYEIPQIKETAVVAIANQPIAFVIARGEGPKPEAIIAYCKRRLPPELVPRMVVFVDEFPRTFIGKVIRRELARRYEQYQANDHESDKQRQ
ncbi:MAG TPA: alpha/beta fold hydrolase [Anaerolineales bacterium]|nr:alpha/beta fold hydrolase [Anaerolineales bacterium]